MRHFEGYASVFWVMDFNKDIVLPGAFKQSLKDRNGIIPLYKEHDPKKEIGVINKIFEDEVGLRISAHVDDENVLWETGGLSIGFRAIGNKKNPNTGIRELFEIDLWEISLVEWPLNKLARVIKWPETDHILSNIHLSKFVEDLYADLHKGRINFYDYEREIKQVEKIRQYA